MLSRNKLRLVLAAVVAVGAAVAAFLSPESAGALNAVLSFLSSLSF